MSAFRAWAFAVTDGGMLVGGGCVTAVAASEATVRMCVCVYVCYVCVTIYVCTYVPTAR